VTRTEVDYPLAALWNSTVRLLSGASDDIRSLPDTNRLEARTRSVARLGRVIPARTLRRALDRQQAIAATINRVFDDADIVLTPLCASRTPHLDDCPSNGALRSLRAANTSAWLVPWNLTGQPAISIPTGIIDALPTAIQLVARPNDETTLLALSAQLESAIASR
jgi:amidase